MARNKFQHCFKKSYKCNGNSKRTHEAIKTTSSINKETTTTTDDQDNTGIERIQISHIRSFHRMIMNDEKSMGYIDLTGRFPHCSASSREYLLVGYNYDANAILVEPLKH